jgi:ribose-phosphate pyrophosphokinase
MTSIKWNKYAIIFGTSHPELKQQIEEYLGVKSVDLNIRTFGNSEIDVRMEENIRNKRAIIIQSPVKDDDKSVNDYLTELLLICNAAKLSSVKSITCIIPCFPYSRADKKDRSRMCIGARVICDMLKSQNVSRVVTVDLHAGQLQGFIDVPFDNLYAMHLFCRVIKKLYLSGENSNQYVLVSPDAGSNKRVNAYASVLKMPVMLFDKQRDYTKISAVESSTLVTQNVDPTGKIAIIIDDIVDTMGTMVSVVNSLATTGISHAIIIATHAVLSGEAVSRINNCALIKSVIVTNTLPLQNKMQQCNKIIKVNVCKLLGDVIKCLITGDTISDMFKELDVNEFNHDSVVLDANKNEINFFY